MWLNLLLLALLALMIFIIGMRVNPNATAFKALERLLLGAAIVYGYNLLAVFFDMQIGLNPITCLTAGFLGVPGLGLLAVLRLMG